jgi:hypothetical protein
MPSRGARNLYYYNPDLDVLKRLKEEYEFLGKKTKLEADERKLTVYAVPPKKDKKEKKVDKKKSR